MEDKGFFNRQPHQKVDKPVTRLALMTTLFVPFTLVKYSTVFQLNNTKHILWK